MRVAENLNLDMAHAREIALEIDVRLSESGGGFGRSLRECGGKVFRRFDDAHAAPAAAAGRLQQQWIADAIRQSCGLVRLAVRILTAWD